MEIWLQVCYSDATALLLMSYWGDTGVLQDFDRVITKVLHMCKKGFTKYFPGFFIIISSNFACTCQVLFLGFPCNIQVIF